MNDFDVDNSDDWRERKRERAMDLKVYRAVDVCGQTNVFQCAQMNSVPFK